ncbi:peptidyl-tRNA hydrolase [Catenovulum agarivorans DS-2]|uniref:Peptidyl-tRNA hydrolase n=1 Tax=Catenovulum agarivorans DS-2 TaxID=1328313 RepID=W7QBS7_9ALTE|nr:aminoacyl-tRNA hydrolase [Catenovulum agarivorans]EWH10304.1 peptidyl-tRNA hydrolase [Catenovulum agarivorans DS-2]
MSDSVQLIVGLANPGSQYQNTRHNAGEWYIQELARRYNATLKLDNKFYGFTGQVTINGQDVKLLVPTTFMNKSGQAIGAMAQFYKIPAENILVAHDELDLPPGIAKFKRGGGHGGHNGLRDTISRLANNKDFLRLRIGIGHPGHKDKVTGYVLGKAPAIEQSAIDAAVDEAARCTEVWFKDGFNKAMNRLHSFKA